ncbi:MAG: hypothetical protein U0359_41805 [Byssovorax sp.]
MGEYKLYRSASEAKVSRGLRRHLLPRRPEILPNGPEMGPGYDAYRILARERHAQPFPAMIPNPKAPIRIEPGDRAFTGAIFADPKSGW